MDFACGAEIRIILIHITKWCGQRGPL